MDQRSAFIRMLEVAEQKLHTWLAGRQNWEGLLALTHGISGPTAAGQFKRLGMRLFSMNNFACQAEKASGLAG